MYHLVCFLTFGATTLTGIFDYRVNSTHEFAMYVHASNENATEEHRVTSFDDYLILNGEVIELHFRVKAD